MAHVQPQHAQNIVPCECGSGEPYWHGDPCGRREYCCDECWARRNGTQGALFLSPKREDIYGGNLFAQDRSLEPRISHEIEQHNQSEERRQSNESTGRNF